MGAGEDSPPRSNPPALAAPAEHPRLFNFDAQGIRVLGSSVTPWFVAKDVCDALGIGNSRQALTALEDDEKGVSITDTLGGPQELATVNESGLYALIFRSRKPQARLFRRWVTGSVLPAIRRTGRYTPTPVDDAPRVAGRSWGLPTSYGIAAKHLGQLAEILLGVRPRVSHSIFEIACTATSAGLFTWLIENDENMNERIALACTIVRLAGMPLVLPRGGSATVTPIGRNRHRRYLFAREKEVPHA